MVVSFWLRDRTPSSCMPRISLVFANRHNIHWIFRYCTAIFSHHLHRDQHQQMLNILKNGIYFSQLMYEHLKMGETIGSRIIKSGINSKFQIKDTQNKIKLIDFAFIRFLYGIWYDFRVIWIRWCIEHIHSWPWLQMIVNTGCIFDHFNAIDDFRSYNSSASFPISIGCASPSEFVRKLTKTVTIVQ